MTAAAREFNNNAINNVLAKCEQYWNEHGICDAEVHAVLEFIHREASKTEPLIAACDRLVECDAWDRGQIEDRLNAMEIELAKVKGE